MKRKNLTKSLSFMLSMSMVLSSALPATAYAEGNGTESQDVNMEAEVVPGGAKNAADNGVETEPSEGENETGETNLTEANDESDSSENDSKVQESQSETETEIVTESESEALAETETPLDAKQETTEENNKGALEDGIHDSWAQDTSTQKGGEICKVADGYLHLKSGSANGNNPSATAPPAIFTNGKEYNFNEAGYFEANFKTEQAGSLNRTGIYIGYKNQNHGMFFGYNASGWYWQKYGEATDPWSPNVGTVPAAGSTVKVKVEWTADKKANFYVDGTALFSDVDFSKIVDQGNQIGIKAGTFKSASTTEITEVFLKDIHYTGQAEAEKFAVSGKVVENVDGKTQAVEGAAVKLNGKTVQTDKDGNYNFADVAAGKYKVTVTKEGYLVAEKEITVAEGAVAVENIVLEKAPEVAYRTISSDQMDVDVAEKFPSVVKYTMKGDLKGKVFYGQTEAIDVIKINGTEIKVTEDNLDVKFDKDKATYTMTLKGQNIDAVLTAIIAVKDNELSFDITKVLNNLDNDVYPVQTIEIPHHSLISVRSTQKGANLKAAKVSSNTSISGDSYVDVKDGMTFSKEDFMYGFVSNDELSAGLWSNSEYNGTHKAAYVGSGGSSNTRVWAETTNLAAGKSLGLSSTLWYYDRKVEPSVNGVKKAYVVEHDADVMPSAKVVITGDENADDQIDWQDGAIAYRAIMNNPFKSEEVPDLVSQRIAMNFGSEAANPFLTTLDGVKRVYLNTDGLGQSIILKGYGSEGHDSGHPDYGNIGERIGGAKDMNELMTEGGALGARFGIHINASEMYPEAKAFDDDLSRHNFGWNWLDQGIGINGMYDLASDRREGRLDELKAKVGNNLDFIYLDVWGNNTSGNEDAWESRKIAKQMNDHGWRFTTEWGPTQEYDSTLQHWAADLGYGGYAAKGQNSEVMRFLRNHQKDSWVADYPSYNGAAQSPLLGGLNMTDFEGWSGRTDYSNYINTTFTHNVLTKFLQHYKVMKWVDGEPVTMKNGGGTFQWTPEMEITLQDDAKENTVVVSRDSNDYAGDLKAYRSRTITLNGKVVSKGAPTGGDGSNPGDETYLLPWYWDTNGEIASEEKLYHWNTKGGDTTWELPGGWEGLANVVVYELTDEGKQNKTVVPVANGHVTLANVKAETPYVVYQGEQGQLPVDWQSTPYIYDVGFNSGSLDSYWTAAGTGLAEIFRNSSENPMLKLSGDVSVTSKALTNLEAGKKYALYVGVDNRSNAKAYMTVNADGKEIASNYTGRSIVQNIVSSNQHHTGSGATTGGTSYVQNMYVFFEAPAGGEVTLTLKRDQGDGDTYFDDLRVVETGMDLVKETDKNGMVTMFQQDFENNAQGIFPFVIAGPGSGAGAVTDNRIHLSELHAPYTQAGYNANEQGQKKLDDVLNGDWSVKINGLTSNNSMIYQTIPQNFHFEPGVTYNVKFKYQMGSRDTYKVTVGEGEFAGNTQLYTMPEAIGQTKEYSFSLIGGESGQSWFGIYSTSTAPDLKEYASAGDGAKNFSGYKDFILDDLVIEVSDIQKGDLQRAINTANTKFQQDYTNETWGVFAEALAEAEEVLNNQNATKEQVETATDKLTSATEKLVAIIGSVSGTVKDADGKPIADTQITLSSNNLAPIEIRTDDKGSYKLENIFIRNYSAKVVKDGYASLYAQQVTPVADTMTTFDFTLQVKEIPEYFNYFENGVDSIQNLAGNPSQVEIESVQYNGSGALKASFGSDRPSIIDTAAPKFKDGIFEADVTPQASPLRFGFVLRANNHNQRLYVGYGDSEGKWFWEYWNGTSNNYSGMFSGPMMEIGKTSHIKTELVGNKLSLWVDGTEVMKEAVVNGLFNEAGSVGFNKRNGGSMIFDNLEVTSYDEVENSNAIEGSIVDENDAPIYQVNVALTDADGNEIASTITNLNGIYNFSKIPYGTYKLAFTKAGYEAGAAEVEVKAESSSVVGKVQMVKVQETTKTELNAKIAEAKAIKKGDYTDASFNALTAAIAAAEKVAADPKATQAAIDAQVKALDAAIKNLQVVTPQPSKTALNAKIAEAKAIKKGNYTDASFNALSAAIAEAEKVAADPKATQAAIDAQTAALTKAIQGLKADPDKEAAAKVQASTVTVKAANQASRYIKLSWNKVADADGYVVMNETSKGWKTVKTIKKNSTTSYVYKKAELGKKYKFAVKAYKKADGKTVYSKYKKVSIKAVPQSPAIRAKASKGSVKVTWKKVSSVVTGYRIYRKTGKTWSRIGIVDRDTTIFKDKKVKKGKTYTYRVRAYRKSKGKNVYGKYSNEIKLQAK